MQGNHVFFTVHVPGTLTANITPIFQAPFPLQLVQVSACSTTGDTDATLAAGTMADDDAYLEAAAIANSGSPADFGRTDFVGDQYPHIAAGDFVKFTLDFDGSAGSAAQGFTLNAVFAEG